MSELRSSRLPRIIGSLSLTVFWAGAAVGVHAQQAEFRGMWVSRYDGWTSSDKNVVMGKIDEIMTNLADNHFNAVLFQIRGQADTFYPSPYEPWSQAVGLGWTDFDPTDYAIGAAHSRGLEFHAYVNTHVCWGGSTPPGNYAHLYYRHCNAADPDARDWLIHDYSGMPVQLSGNYVWIAPGVPAAQAYLRRQIMYIVKTYPVDGLHFDRIRTSSSSYSYDPISMSRYSGDGNPNNLSFHPWTCDQITRFLGDTYAQVMEVKPQVKISASPFGWNDYLSVHQDPAAWYSSGAVDALMPMMYGYGFSYYLPPWLGFRAGRHVYAGQSTDDVTIDEYIYDINLVRASGGEGTTVFSYKGFNNYDYWDELSGSGGPYESAASLPTMPWKTNPVEGVIIGTIVGLDGMTPLVDVHVTRSGSDYTALSSGDGLYSFLKVPPGSHTLTFEKTGCVPIPPQICAVAAGQVTRVDVKMGEGALVKIVAQPTSIREGREVHFEPAVSLPTGGNIVSYTWVFGNGTVTGAGMPVAINHRYETQGTYQASLEVLTAGSGSFTSNQVQITVNTAVGDFDADHDVDLADFAHVQACLDGPGVAQNDPACQDAQLDADDDVDNNDLRIVVGCLSGADIPVNTKCAP